MNERAPPDQLDLFLDPEDDGSWESFIRHMSDPAMNPQLRGDPPSTSRSHQKTKAQRETNLSTLRMPEPGHR